MADCRMGARKSGEIIEGGGPTQIVSGGASGSMRNGMSGSNHANQVNPSKSYHQQLQQPQHLQHQQPPLQFFNMNGFPPVGMGMYCLTPLCHQTQPQFVGGGGVDCGGGGCSPPYGNNQQSGLDSPARPWIPLSPTKHRRACFTVLCYNILCSRYATPTLYSYCPGWALDWNYRRKAILQELVHYSPDIVSLQEMETDQFYNFFLPQLQNLGYSGIFGAKSRARTMVESKRKLVDGCAIFYKTAKFRLLSEHLIEFSQVAIASAHGRGEEQQFSEEMINRVQTKDNIALVALLEIKSEPEQGKDKNGLIAPTSRPLLVCNCHIHWDPNFCDVKLVQTMMLMQELRKITDNIDTSQWTKPSGNKKSKRKSTSPQASTSTSTPSTSTSTPSTSSSSASTLDKANILVCGDFNSLPQSGVVQFMESGTISCIHPDFKGLSYEDYLDSSTKLSPGRSGSTPQVHPPQPEEFKHGFNLHSAYPSDVLPFTNYTLEFQGVIDYVFHSVKGLRPVGLLGPLDSSWLVQNNIVGAPHPNIPSDHLPLLVELEMTPAI